MADELPDPDSAPYWEGVAQGELRYQRCGACDDGHLREVGASTLGPPCPVPRTRSASRADVCAKCSTSEFDQISTESPPNQRFGHQARPRSTLN